MGCFLSVEASLVYNSSTKHSTFAGGLVIDQFHQIGKYDQISFSPRMLKLNATTILYIVYSIKFEHLEHKGTAPSRMSMGKPKP